MSETPDKAAKNEWIQAILLVAFFILLFFGFKVLYTFMASGDRAESAKAEADVGRWQTFEKMYFSVSLPEAPAETHVGKEEIDETMSDYALYTAHNGEHMVVIEEMTFKPGMGPADSDSFIAGRGALVENAPGSIVSFRSDDDFKGSPARRYDFFLPESKQYTHALLILKRGEQGLPDRYYTISELSYKDDYDAADFERLANSFNPN